jgi:hypothetical protein
VEEEPANSLQYEDRDDQSRAHNDKQQAENCDDKYPIASSRSRGRGRVAAEQFVVAHVRLEPERKRIAQPRNNPDQLVDQDVHCHPGVSDSQEQVNCFSILAMRRAIAKSVWAEIKTAFATGSVSLRELARQMNIPEGTILSKAKREGWTQQIQSAKALAKREDASPAVTPVQAVAASMQQRGERHLGRMANIVEKTVPHVEAMEPSAILDRIDDVETLDKVARRTFGISDLKEDSTQCAVNIAILNA